MAVTERDERQTIDRVLARVDERNGELSRTVTETIAGNIGDYGPIDWESPFWQDVREFGASQIRGAMKAGRTGGDPSIEDLAVIRAATVRRVEQGVQLQAILHAFRVGHRIVWNAVVEEAARVEGGREAALGLTLPFMRFVDTVCTCITETYLDHQHRAARAAERAARDLLELLIAGDPNVMSLARTEGIELDLDEPHVVVVATTAGDGYSEGLRSLADAIGSRLGGLPVLSVIRQDEATFVMPAASAAPSEICELLRIDGDHADPMTDLRAKVGVGLAAEGVGGIAESHRQARSALAFCRDGDFVVGLEEVPVIEYLTARDDPVATSMVSPAVRELAVSERPMDRTLRETVDAFLACDMNVTRTAARLPAHPNTVHYRLRKIGELTGVDPRNLDQMVELRMAIMLSRRGSRFSASGR